MLNYDDALAQILEKAPTPPPAETPLLDALGCVLAEDVLAPFPLPPFANSAMDGYAVRARDVEAAVALPVHGESAAGVPCPHPLAPQTAIRIMTGALLPEGADAVVPIEDVEESADSVLIKEPVVPGQHVREAGEEVSLGTIVVSAETPLRPAEIGILAAVGRRSVSVYSRPRVAIVSTGDELVEPGQELGPSQIYNSNAYALAAQVEEAGGIVTHRLHARDTPDALRAAFDACAGADVLLTSGGVSVGAHDYVKAVFGERGTVDFWRVAIRPGRPLAFGQWDQTIFFGLPGNPASAGVTFELFVRPTLRKMRGLPDLFRPTVQAQLTEPVAHLPDRRSFLRAFVTRDGDSYSVRPVSKQGSGMASSLALANALLILPHDLPALAAGDFATVLLLTGE